MGGDYTRFTWSQSKRYSRVLLQQGRVLLDADWNEEGQIGEHLRETALQDVIGACGAPRRGGGFRIEATPRNLVITYGKIYVDGILCENLPSERQVTDHDEDGGTSRGELARPSGFSNDDRLLITGQPDLPFPAATFIDRLIYLVDPEAEIILEIRPAHFLVYLDVWKRHITALEDPGLREVALGGPDTANRLKTVWQVKLLRLSGPTTCGAELPEWDALTARPSGRLIARTSPQPQPDDPCVVPAAGGYRGLENQLYRVEVHRGGVLGGDEDGSAPPVFKWSRENGSVTEAWTETLIVGGLQHPEIRSLGRDEKLGFQDAPWVELRDDGHDLTCGPGGLFRLAGVQGTTLLLKPPGPTDTVGLLEELPARASTLQPKARRWEGRFPPPPPDDETALEPVEPDRWYELENGIEIRLGPGTYRACDYWLIPARAFIGELAGDIEWPRNRSGDPLAQPPQGIEHHYCRLALVEWEAPGRFAEEVTDCRDTFLSLTDLEECCCCTVSVGDGVRSHGEFQSLHQALREAVARYPDPAVPIHICILPGRHVLPQALTIDRDNVTVEGCGRSAELVASARGPGFAIEAAGVTLQSLFCSTVGGDPWLRATGARLRIVDCDFELGAGPAAEILRMDGLEVVHSRFTLGGQRGLIVQGRDLLVSNNRFTGAFDPQDPTGVEVERGCIDVRIGSQGARILDNEILTCPGHGITLASPPAEAGFSFFTGEILIAGNTLRALGGSGITRPPVAARPPDIPDDFDVAEQPEVEMAPFLLRQINLQLIPGPIDGLRIEDNQIVECVRASHFGPAAGQQGGREIPEGGIILFETDHLVIARNRIEDNGRFPSIPAGGHETPQIALPIAGVFLRQCRGVVIQDNQIRGNGPSADLATSSRLDGGVLAFDLAQSEGFSGSPLSRLFPVSNMPDGWPAAMMQGNVVEAPRGLVLRLDGTGPMQIMGNHLTGHDPRGLGGYGVVHVQNNAAAPVLGFQGQARGFAAGFALQVPGSALPPAIQTVSGLIAFSDNQVTYHPRGPVSMFAAIGLLGLDDLVVLHNQVDCVLAADRDLMMIDLFARGAFVRALGNGFQETLTRVRYSLYAGGSVLATGTDNQGTHCIEIAAPHPTRRVDRDNLAVACRSNQQVGYV